MDGAVGGISGRRGTLKYLASLVTRVKQTGKISRTFVRCFVLLDGAVLAISVRRGDNSRGQYDDIDGDRLGVVPLEIVPVILILSYRLFPVALLNVSFTGSFLFS